MKKTKKMFIKFVIVFSIFVIVGSLIFKCVSEWK